MSDINREVGELKMQARYMTQELAEIKKDVKLLVSRDSFQRGKMFVWSAIAAFAGLVTIELAKSLLVKLAEAATK